MGDLISTFNSGITTFTSSAQQINFFQNIYLRSITVRVQGNNENAYASLTVQQESQQAKTTDRINIGEGVKSVTFPVEMQINITTATRDYTWLNVSISGSNFSVFGGTVAEDYMIYFQGTMAHHDPQYKNRIWDSQYDVTNEKVCTISGDTPRLINNSGEDWNDWARDSEGYPFNITVPKINAELNGGLPFFFLMDDAQPITSRLYYNGEIVPLYYNGRQCSIFLEG